MDSGHNRSIQSFGQTLFVYFPVAPPEKEEEGGRTLARRHPIAPPPLLSSALESTTGLLE
jgi:hypothetical protein